MASILRGTTGKYKNNTKISRKSSILKNYIWNYGAI